ncbi:MAG: hypothetical protein HQL47_03955 [Gammaproteobacteria bacterium]|nr:hypothetical protein [Gammaproteobacteria bacterium]
MNPSIIRKLINKGLYSGILLACLISPTAFAMDAQAMQATMAVMEQLRSCMAGIDQTKLEQLQAKGEAIQAEIQGLCQSGQRDEAQKRGLKYAAEMTSDPDLKQMLNCAEQAKNAMAKLPKIPGMPPMPDLSLPQIDDSNHVCD